jgi:hypothetical protein
MTLTFLAAGGCQAPEAVAPAPEAMGAATEQGEAVTGPARGEAKAVMVEQGPEIDGTLASPLWNKCPPLELGMATSDKPAPLKTVARVLFSPTHLYLGVGCAEPDTEGIKKAVTKRDGPVYSDDSIEFFVSGDPRVGYFQFVFNARGTMMDGTFKPGQHVNKSWNSSAEVKAGIEKDERWVLTVKIPLKELGAYVGDDQVWAMNLNRNRSGGKNRKSFHLSWSIMTKTDWHQVNDYGMVTGVRVPKRADGVTRTASALPKPPEYLKGRKVGGVRVYKTVDALTIPDEGQGTKKSLPLPIRGSRDLKIGFLARGTDGVSHVPFNVFDARARDNTTPKAYYWVSEDWRPLLYRVPLFRYNARVQSTVAPATDFRSLVFHGNRTGGKGVLYLKHFVVYRGDDRAAPAAPGGLKAEVTDGGVKLSWNAAEDNTAPAGYSVARAEANGAFAKVGHVTLPPFVDKPGKAGTYRYRVLAFDLQDNLSPWSEAVSVKVGTAFTPELPSQEEKDRRGYAKHVYKVHASGMGKVIRGRVLCYGDSLTGATNYRHYCASALGRYEVIAKGYPAMRTSFGRKHIEGHMKQYTPEYCLILYGTNNNKSPKNIPPAIEDMMEIARTCETYGTVPVIGTIPPRGFRDPESKPEARYNAALIEACRKNHVPIAYIFEEYQTCGMDRKKLLAGDGVHTVTGGWVCMGKAWQAAMEQVWFAVLNRPE